MKWIFTLGPNSNFSILPRENPGRAIGPPLALGRPDGGVGFRVEMERAPRLGLDGHSWHQFWMEFINEK